LNAASPRSPHLDCPALEVLRARSSAEDGLSRATTFMCRLARVRRIEPLIAQTPVWHSVLILALPARLLSVENHIGGGSRARSATAVVFRTDIGRWIASQGMADDRFMVVNVVSARNNLEVSCTPWAESRGTTDHARKVPYRKSRALFDHLVRHHDSRGWAHSTERLAGAQEGKKVELGRLNHSSQQVFLLQDAGCNKAQLIR